MSHHRGRGGVPCVECWGKGWTHRAGTPRDGWSDLCSACNGRGQLTYRRLAQLLEVDVVRIYETNARRLRGKRAVAVLDKLLPYVEKEQSHGRV